jgi:hypothetical protein
MIVLMCMGRLAAAAVLSTETTTQIGRGDVTLGPDSVTVDDAYLVINDSDVANFTFSFQGRAPEGAKPDEVGIWATFRQLDRNHRYALGVRGAPHCDLYLARYAPDGDDRMLALQPVPAVQPGEWVDVQITGFNELIKVSFNGDELISVTDPNASFTHGMVGVGGGYHAGEYRNVEWHALSETPVKADSNLTFVPGAIKINFQPEDASTPEGWTADSGKKYTAERGSGWTEPAATRNRETAAGVLNDTLVTLAHGDTNRVFRMDLAEGDWLLTLQHGDRFLSKLNLQINAATQPVISETGLDEFKQEKIQLHVGQEGLMLSFSRPAGGKGTSVNWLVVEPKDQLSAAQWAAGKQKDQAPAKEILRKEQRKACTAAKLDSIGPARTEFSLDGDWLLLPDYEFSKTPSPEAVDAEDAGWHVMHVPDMWSPYAAWLFGETMHDIPYDKGASDSYFEYRHARVEALTFDWDRTKSAWYRKQVVLPPRIEGKQIQLCFDAIAKVSHIYVNGEFVGKNYGMFGGIKLDVTKQMKPGINVIAVKVDDELNVIENGGEIVDVAISVEITRQMLAALPFGMTRQNPRGIWQPVKMVITDPVRIDDVFVKPTLEGADVDVSVSNSGPAATVVPQLTVTSKQDQSRLIQLAGEPVELAAQESRVVTLSFGNLKPDLWAPNHPNLYTFDVKLLSKSAPVDQVSVVSGFKTVEIKGNRFYLNGRPYALRGANHCPNLLAPNDGALADRFTTLMRENNLNATRFHALPATTPWMDAADRNGILVSYEGTWPWLLLRGPIPSRASIDIWMDEYRRLIKKYRNHPSLMLWTINNEMKFHDLHLRKDHTTPEEDADIFARWQIVSDAVKMVRKTDPTHPVSADSCYVRKSFWTESRSPEELGIDDGDVDDRHIYFNWYRESFFHLFDSVDDSGSSDRPYISQEASTGYYNGDSGHPVRAYLFAHQTPQTWVGQWAYEHQDPAFFLTRHCMLTKETAEYFRRERREDWAGTLIFGLVTWFQNQWLADEITPYPVVTDGLRHAMAPVLVSTRLTGRNVFAGEWFTVPVSIVNDAEDGQPVAAGTLNWSVEVDGKKLSQGSLDTPPVPYYSNYEQKILLEMPEQVPGGRADAQLRFELTVDGKVISENHYALCIAEKAWAIEPVQAVHGQIFAYKPSIETEKMLQQLLIPARVLHELAGLTLEDSDRLLIDGPLSDPDRAALHKLIAAGSGKIVWANAREQAVNMFPQVIRQYRPQQGEVVTMRVDESPVFDGIQIGDLSWMGGPSVRTVPYSATGGYHVEWQNPSLHVLAESMNRHGYLKKPTDKLNYWMTPLVEIHENGSVPVILSEMSIRDALTDPVALRLWANLLAGK